PRNPGLRRRLTRDGAARPRSEFAESRGMRGKVRTRSALGEQEVVLAAAAVGAALEGGFAAAAAGGDRVLAGGEFGGEGAGTVGDDRRRGRLLRALDHQLLRRSRLVGGDEDDVERRLGLDRRLRVLLVLRQLLVFFRGQS